MLVATSAAYIARENQQVESAPGQPLTCPQRAQVETVFVVVLSSISNFQTCNSQPRQCDRNALIKQNEIKQRTTIKTQIDIGIVDAG